jgi:4-hydroxy-4-methyl-2-oxoglutarate aldolase
MVHVIRNYPRPSLELVQKFNHIGSATVYEAVGKRGALDSGIKPIWPGAKILGVALTVKCFPGDNLMVHKALTMVQPGDVIVCDVDDYTEAGGWGEVASTALQALGGVGYLTNGAVRDQENIMKMKFPVFARNLCIKGTGKEHLGTINHPVVLGGTVVRPGDIILGDADGVVVIPREEAEWSLDVSLKREAAETIQMEEIRKGKYTLDLLNLRQTLERKGCSEE